jgi:hypothetical protein
VRYIALVAAGWLLATVGHATAQTPAQQMELLMIRLVGTTAVNALPQFADGKLSSCLLEYSLIARDDQYRQGGFMKVFGSFGLMEAKGSVAITLKIVVQDIDMKTAEFRPSPPANSYFVFGTETSKASLVGKYPSDTPGAQFSVFKPLPTDEKIVDALDKGKITVAFNRRDGGADIVIPIDLTVSNTDDAGKKTRSQQMILDFHTCTGELLKGTSGKARQ